MMTETVELEVMRGNSIDPDRRAGFAESNTSVRPGNPAAILKAGEGRDYVEYMGDFELVNLRQCLSG